MSRQNIEAEIERGRIIAARAKRASDLSRLVAGKKLKIMCALPGHRFYEPHGRVELFYLYDDVKADGVPGPARALAPLAHENIDHQDYPSEALMATLMLVVGATVGLDGIPSAETIDPLVRKARDEYRKHLPNGLATP